MSSLLCKCGNELSGTISPSPYFLDIYTEKELREALEYRPDIDWILLTFLGPQRDEKPLPFMLRNENVEYWYCPECGRVYEVGHHTGNFLRIYKRTCSIPEIPEDGLETIYAFTETYAEDCYQGKNYLSAEEFLLHMPHKYIHKMTPDERCVITYQEGKPVYAHVLEKEFHWNGEKYTVDEYDV